LGLQKEPEPLEDFERPPAIREKAESTDKEATLWPEETKGHTACPSPLTGSNKAKQYTRLSDEGDPLGE